MSVHSDEKPDRSGLWRLLAFLSGSFALWNWFYETNIHGFFVGQVEQHLDRYAPDLTGLAYTVLLIAIPLYLAKRASVHEFELHYDDLARRLKGWIIYLFLAVLVFAGLAYGAFHLHRLTPSKDQPPLKLELASELPSFLFLRKVVLLDGIAISKHATFSKDLRQKQSHILRRYTPIASKKDRQRPIQFVESFTSSSTKSHKAKRVALQGFVSLRMLPVSIRQAFEADGLSMESKVYVIENRFFNIKPYLMAACIVLSLLALGLLIRLILSPKIHRRKLQTAWDIQFGYHKKKHVGEEIITVG